ncbi:F510_1955 family glycosylhydrolase [Halobacillus sp. K22]|uniref:F510_1955 family glycosylhydrolase n=1 Tax=Halobacillus sp. K22 TaxID=3457431 RepID=UPI003FCE605B
MKKVIGIIIFISMLVLGACNSESNQSEGSEEGSDKKKSIQESTDSFDGSVEHVHGMGYVDADTLAYAAHSGIKLHKGGKWLESTHHKNDYMGFNVVDNGFYTSGHPGEGSDLPNPIGLQKGKVTEEGLSALAFEGESDFHAMGVGARNHAVYVWNEHANSQMEQGLYRSLDDGESWEKIAAENSGEKIFQIAVHPDDENIVALATASGIYLSEDGGASFNVISEEGQGSGMHFTKDRLYYGLYTGTPSLSVYKWDDQSKEEIGLPEMNEDAVMYLAKNPEKKDTFAIFTIKGNSYTTSDNGESWEQIIDQGQTK